MSEDKVQPKRDQVLNYLKEGGHTREEIATKLSMSVASVNSQLTYLRWMNNFIVYDEDKKLSLCTEQEFNDWEASKAANKKAPAVVKSPEEQFTALQKSLTTDEKNLSVWAEKFNTAKAAWEQDTENEELPENCQEAAAMTTLLSIKVKRAKKKLAVVSASMPVTVEEVIEPALSVDADDII